MCDVLTQKSNIAKIDFDESLCWTDREVDHVRDDFSEPSKRILSSRVGGRCSRPECRAPTSGPHANPAAAISVGVAAHITAASPGGPRYDPTLSAAERVNIENGIWLCQNCAKLADSDTERFSVIALRGWKRDTEEISRQETGLPAIGPTIEHLTRQLQGFTGTIYQRVSDSVQALQRQIEDDNPDLAVSIQFEADRRTYSFRFKKGISSAAGGELEFPATAAGRRGIEKFNRVLDLGVTESFEAGEFSFKPALRLRELETSTLDTQATLRIGPSKSSSPSTEVHVDVIRTGQRAVLIPLTTLTVVRHGRKEVELRLAGGLLAGSVTIVWQPTQNTVKFELDMDLASHPAGTALRTVLLAQAFVDDVRIEVIPLTATTSALAFQGEFGNTEKPFDDAVELLGWLATIGEAYGMDLRYPESVDDATFDTAWVLATAITEGQVTLAENEPFKRTITGPDAARLRESWMKGEHPNIRFTSEDSFSFMEHELPVGTVVHFYCNARPSSEDWREEPPDALLVIQAAYIRHQFLRWKRNKATAPETGRSVRLPPGFPSPCG